MVSNRCLRLGTLSVSEGSEKKELVGLFVVTGETEAPGESTGSRRVCDDRGWVGGPACSWVSCALRDCMGRVVLTLGQGVGRFEASPFHGVLRCSSRRVPRVVTRHSGTPCEPLRLPLLMSRNPSVTHPFRYGVPVFPPCVLHPPAVVGASRRHSRRCPRVTKPRTLPLTGHTVL